jgi:hypothetical protein
MNPADCDTTKQAKNKERSHLAETDDKCLHKARNLSGQGQAGGQDAAGAVEVTGCKIGNTTPYLAGHSHEKSSIYLYIYLLSCWGLNQGLTHAKQAPYH